MERLGAKFLFCFVPELDFGFKSQLRRHHGPRFFGHFLFVFFLCITKEHFDWIEILTIASEDHKLSTTLLNRLPRHSTEVAGGWVLDPPKSAVLIPKDNLSWSDQRSQCFLYIIVKICISDRTFVLSFPPVKPAFLGNGADNHHPRVLPVLGDHGFFDFGTRHFLRLIPADAQVSSTYILSS